MQLNIPEKRLNEIRALNDLAIKDLEVFLSEIRKEKFQDISELESKNFSFSQPNLNKKNLQKIISAFQGLYFIREYSGVETEKLIEDLAYELNEDYDETFKDKFLTVLNNDNIRILVKAHRLHYDNESLFSNSRIISDIRPVFSSDPSEIPSDMVVNHTLKLSLTNNGKDKEVYASLDVEDLRKLQKSINRAIKKDKTLRKFLGDMDYEIYGQ